MRLSVLGTLGSTLIALNFTACDGSDPEQHGDGAVDAGFDSGDVDATGIDATADAATEDATEEASADAGLDAPVDAAADMMTCTPGPRYPAGDGCNWCECIEGVTVCTTRTSCSGTGSDCEYDGVRHEYAVRFPASDGCNECVCAASGLACTRRECDGEPAPDEGAILLESNNEPCGDDTSFTVNALLGYIDPDGYELPLLYARDRAEYPESRADTVVHVRAAYTTGYAVCRIPMPGQEAIDLEADIEITSDDGAFNEGFHTYLRRTVSRFVDEVNFVASLSTYSELEGAYTPDCFAPGGISFEGHFQPAFEAYGEIMKACERDIGLTVATWATDDPTLP